MRGREADCELGDEGLRLVVEGCLIEEPVVLGVPQVRGVRRGGLERGRASGQLEAFEDLPSHRRILDRRDEPQRRSAPRALQSIDLEDAL